MAPATLLDTPPTEPVADFKVLVLAGSYAGLAAVTALLDLSHGRRARYDYTTDPVFESKTPLDITVVDERDGFMHIVGNPLALADRKYGTTAWQKFSEIPGVLDAPGVKFIQGSVKSVDSKNKNARITTISGKTQEIPYDYVVVATGLRRVWPTVPSETAKSGFLDQCHAHLDQVEKTEKGVVVIGGGAVGIEIAAELEHMHPEIPVTLIHSRARLLSSEPLPDEFAEAALQLLKKTKVDVILNSRVQEVKQISANPPLYSVLLSTGRSVETSCAISGISHQHPTGSEFLPAGAVDETGLVHINANLSIKTLPDGHFCAGDAVKWSGIKRAGAAMWMGYLAAHNIFQRILVARGELKAEEVQDKKLDPIPPMMGLAVGNEAVEYREGQPVRAGEDVRKYLFGDDLGWSICWNYMKLGEKFEA